MVWKSMWRIITHNGNKKRSFGGYIITGFLLSVTKDPKKATIYKTRKEVLIDLVKSKRGRSQWVEES